MAAWIGSLVLGLMVTLAEMNADVRTFLDFSKSYGLGSGSKELPAKGGRYGLGTLTRMNGRPNKVSSSITFSS